MIELDFSLEATVGHDRGPRGKMDFATADLYDLTHEASQGPVTFAMEGTDCSGVFPVLDFALGMTAASKELASVKRARYCVADAGVDFLLERRGDTVSIRLNSKLQGTVGYQQFVDAVRVFTISTLKILPKKFPGLNKNTQFQALARKYN
ncbi:hypothetical protein [Streptomyces sp. NPDC047014]|uniref:hypothetical protein n=1 Tax=Streptomyces sp. NPDC047014 TaxID=3155736 RepID=UPI0033EBF593